MTDGHAAPFDYIAHAFFEGEVPGHQPVPADCIVWANRGGGKTFLGAVATMLDLVFKPGIQVRILAGSLEQASRMHEHLRTLFEREVLKGEVKGRITERRIVLHNGSRVELLAPSQASVRGVRPQKLRCDEVELFDPDVWSAAQLTTRSVTIDGRRVRGAIECLSTMHRPHGLMSRLIEEGSRTVFKWGLVDVLERCGEEHACNPPGHPCPLLRECNERAKAMDRLPGHMSVRDAITLKSRVAPHVWESEMLCTRPSRSDCVIPEFDRDRHVVEQLPWETGGESPDFWAAGMDFGLHSPTVFLWAAVRGGCVYVVDERHESGVTLDVHIREILGSTLPRPEWIGADPSGGNRSEQTGRSSIECLKRAGFAVRARRAPIVEGLSLIRARLNPADGSPARLIVHARCRRLIESLESYHYDAEQPFKDEPVKDGPDHAVDALRYLLTNLDRPFSWGQGRYG